jgi:uncharacterized protein (DUF1697 family)
MPALRDVVSGLGFSDVRTLVQSGNIIFCSKTRYPKEREGLLGSETKAKLGLDTDFFVRSAKDWKVLIERNPFPGKASGIRLISSSCFSKTLPAQSAAELRGSIRGREVVGIEGKQAYIVYPDGIGRSRLTNAVRPDFALAEPAGIGTLS